MSRKESPRESVFTRAFLRVMLSSKSTIKFPLEKIVPLHYSISGDSMKLSFKKAKLLTVLLLGFYLMMLLCGLYYPLYLLCIPSAYLAALGMPFLFYLAVGFFKEKLCVQLLN